MLTSFNNFWHAASQGNDVNNCSFVHLTLILLLHYLVKCRSRILVVYNSGHSYWEVHTGSENHCGTTKSLKICYLFNQQGVYHIKISDVDELK